LLLMIQVTPIPPMQDHASTLNFMRSTAPLMMKHAKGGTRARPSHRRGEASNLLAALVYRQSLRKSCFTLNAESINC
jgi:hypothetical protein